MAREMRVGAVAMALALMVLSFGADNAAGDCCSQAKIDGGAGDEFGSSISADGLFFAAGKPGAGQVQVFTLFGQEWVPDPDMAPLFGHIDAPAEAAMVGFGSVVELRGSLLAVGNPAVNEVFVFERSGGMWNPTPVRTLHTESGLTLGGSDQFGAALTMDGDRLFVGAPGPDSSAEGYVVQFSLSATGAESTISITDMDENRNFGYSLVYFASLDYLVIGSPFATFGGVWEYEVITPTVATVVLDQSTDEYLPGTLLAGTGPLYTFGRFGFSMAGDRDNDLLVIGAPNVAEGEQALLFDLVGGADLSAATLTLLDLGAASSTLFGFDVAVRAATIDTVAGIRVGVGNRLSDGGGGEANAGSLAVFESVGGFVVNTLYAFDEVASNELGTAIDLASNGNDFLVAADTTGNGAVYIVSDEDDPPGLVISGPTVTIALTVTLLATFDERVVSPALGSLAGLVIAGPGADLGSPPAVTAIIDEFQFEFEITMSGNAGDAVVTFQDDTVFDKANNGNEETSYTVVFDPFPPEVSLVSDADFVDFEGVMVSNADNHKFTATFNEDVVEATFLEGNIAVTNGAVVAGSLVKITENVYCFNVEPDVEGTVTVTVSGVTDLAGNPNVIDPFEYVHAICIHPQDGIQGFYHEASDTCNCKSGYAYDYADPVPSCSKRISVDCFDRSGMEPMAELVSADVVDDNIVIQLRTPVRRDRYAPFATYGDDDVFSACLHPGLRWQKDFESINCFDLYTITLPTEYILACGVERIYTDVPLDDEILSSAAATRAYAAGDRAGAIRSAAAAAAAVADGDDGDKPIVSGATVEGRASIDIVEYVNYIADVIITLRDFDSVEASDGVLVPVETDSSTTFHIITTYGSIFLIKAPAPVTSDHGLQALVVGQAWNFFDEVATIRIATLARQPYQVNSMDAVVTPVGAFVNNTALEMTETPCTATYENNDCFQLWDIVIEPATACEFSGTYTIGVDLLCRDPSGVLEVGNTGCTTDYTEFEFELDSSDICALVFDGDEGVLAVATAYTDDTFAVPTSDYFVGESMFVDVRVLSESWALESIELNFVAMVRADEPVPSAIPMDAVYLEDIYEGPDEVATRFSAYITGASTGNLTIGQSAPFNVLISVEVGYDDGSSRRRAITATQGLQPSLNLVVQAAAAGAGADNGALEATAGGISTGGQIAVGVVAVVVVAVVIGVAVGKLASSRMGGDRGTTIKSKGAGLYSSTSSDRSSLSSSSTSGESTTASVSGQAANGESYYYEYYYDGDTGAVNGGRASDDGDFALM